MITSFTLEQCKTRAGYSAKLPSSQKLNLAKIKQHFQVVLETPILLVIREQGLEIIVHGYGELLFKNGTESQKELMRKIAEKVYGMGWRKQLQSKREGNTIPPHYAPDVI